MLASTSKLVVCTGRALVTSTRRCCLSTSAKVSAANAAVSSSTPTVATSKFMRQTREDALWTPGICWRDEEVVAVGRTPEDAPALVEADLKSVEEGGRETSKMKYVSVSWSYDSR